MRRSEDCEGRSDGSVLSLITDQLGDPNDKQRNKKGGGGWTKRGIEVGEGQKGRRRATEIRPFIEAVHDSKAGEYSSPKLYKSPAIIQKVLL